MAWLAMASLFSEKLAIEMQSYSANLSINVISWLNGWQPKIWRLTVLVNVAMASMALAWRNETSQWLHHRLCMAY